MEEALLSSESDVNKADAPEGRQPLSATPSACFYVHFEFVLKKLWKKLSLKN